MSSEKDPFASPIETKHRNSVHYTLERDAIGLPVVKDLFAVNHFDGKVMRLNDTQMTELRHILMTREIGVGTVDQAKAREDDVPKLSPALMRYSQTTGVDEQLQVARAMAHMGENLLQESLLKLHSFTHQVDNLLEGKVKSDFAAPRLQVAEVSEAHHGLNTAIAKDSKIQLS